MRSHGFRNHIGKLLRWEVPRHAHEQLIESQIAARIDDGSSTVVDNQKLVALNGLTILFHQVREHQASVGFVAVEFNGHGTGAKSERCLL